MTTARSPYNELKVQADRMARTLKMAARGERIADDVGGKIAAAREREVVRFAIVMDDKIISMQMRWAFIQEVSEAGISEYIVSHMQGRQ